MRHRRGLGRFGWWTEEGVGFGPRGMSAGRKLGSGELQLLILALLEEQPRHGYDLIKELTERSGGFYAPSPGMVYPALTYLEELGHTAVEAEGAKKLYRITESGKAELEKNRETARAIFGQFERIARKMERMRRFFAGEAVEEDVDDRAEFRAARHALREALRAARDASPEAQQRVLDIVKRLTDEIRAALKR
ncbi:MAG: helix-turn-helix transcriptional regulator [Alphaproteobacteria bacterium]|nr:helix-turn-helix transcriptional regulator [Alphaproteobacteria bacterium]